MTQISDQTTTLLMLCDLHEQLGLQGLTSPKAIRNDIIRQNFVWGNTRGREQELTDHYIDFVIDVLSMWRHIELSVGDDIILFFFPKEGQAGGLFHGFDDEDGRNFAALGNHLVDDLGLLQHFKGRGLQGNVEGLNDSYERMLPVYRETIAGDTKTPMTMDQLEIVLGPHAVPKPRRWLDVMDDEPAYDITDV
ncbi:YfbU family protein [Brevundimonas albigilva]|uniref:YfbU family protein n=1 Tax=Brevundimonas albigilva TaxID=1312364 RepID=UPI00201B5BDA|nr:YfbU family protein [Brevundimonas albigilva]UQV19058.1 YfbU family protein [Brevundimonas albigilva]